MFGVLMKRGNLETGTHTHTGRISCEGEAEID